MLVREGKSLLGDEAYLALAMEGSFGAGSGPSASDRLRRAFRPIEASKATVRYVRSTSISLKNRASAAAVSEAKPGISASRGEDRRRKGDELRHFPEVLGGGGQ